MRKQLFCAALASLLPMAAIAGGPTDVDGEPPMAAPAASVTDWSGPYAGVMGGTSSGEILYFFMDVPDLAPTEIDGSLAGLFAGYNIQRGAIVYGAELAYSTGDVGYFPGISFTNFLDLKGRLGFASGKTLVYGALGWTKGDWSEVGAGTAAATGMAYGVGIDMMLNDRMMIGAEYLWRKVETSNFPAPFPDITMDGDFGTLSLRLGMTF